MHAIRRALLALTLASVPLGGCVSLERPYPDKQTFGLAAPTLPAPADTPLPYTLRVERVRIAPPADERSFVTRTSETQYQADYYSEFVADPERLVTAEILRALGAANIYGAVLDPAATADADLRLETTITDLYADLRDPALPRSFMRARVLVLEDTRETTLVRATWNLEAAAPARDATPGSIAEAHAESLAKLLLQLAEKLKQAP